MIISDEHRKSFNDFFYSIFKNKDAVDLCLMLIEVAHVWDDLIDKDRDVSDDEINLVFTHLIHRIPKNPIYRAIPSLPDHMLGIYLSWRDATTIEGGEHTEEDLNKCYMLRAELYGVFAVIAYYVCGDEASRAIGPAIRRFYGEKLSDFKEGFSNA